MSDLQDRAGLGVNGTGTCGTIDTPLTQPSSPDVHGWHLIETAPKDGTPIWAYRPPATLGKHQCRVEVKWHEWPADNEAAWIWPCNPVEDIASDNWLIDDYYESLEFTHWLPIPASPPSSWRART